MQVLVVRELLARFVVSHQDGWVNGHLGEAHGFQMRPLLGFILRKRLPLGSFVAESAKPSHQKITDQTIARQI